ncbi:hypothetical protein [Oceanicaulis sp. HTCC2633]|uniref:hypothetical protein n=1 Tax=Oceanicaulis sp. HTCC2633 TaxID=314254 RepID=UPI0002E66985|nr:hypothetical protein [Oceanicaulis sp. HTCC2633]
MRFLRNRARARNHLDLPLFRFAARQDDRRRLSHAEHFMRTRMPLRPPATLKLYAELAGLNVEG